jgi:hypothetical protein
MSVDDASAAIEHVSVKRQVDLPRLIWCDDKFSMLDRKRCVVIFRVAERDQVLKHWLVKDRTRGLRSGGI